MWRRATWSGTESDDWSTETVRVPSYVVLLKIAWTVGATLISETLEPEFWHLSAFKPEFDERRFQKSE